VLDLLFSAALVAVLRGVEPRDISRVEPSSRQAADRRSEAAPELRNVSSWNPPATVDS
jgi:hypothetical protein